MRQVKWARRIEPYLDTGLQLIEQAHCSSRETDQRAVDKWKGRLMAAVPADYKFVGRAIGFSITDPEQARASHDERDAISSRPVSHPHRLRRWSST